MQTLHILSLYNVSLHNFHLNNFCLYNFSLYNFSLYNVSLFNFPLNNFCFYNFSVCNFPLYNFSLYNLSKSCRMENQTTPTYFALEPFNIYNFPPDSDELQVVPRPPSHPMRPSPLHLSESEQSGPSNWTVTPSPPSNMMPNSNLPRSSTPLPHCSEPSLFGFPNNENHIPAVHFADDISAGFSNLPHYQFQEATARILTDLTNSQTSSQKSAPQAAPKSLPPLATRNFFNGPTKRAREDTQPPSTATASLSQSKRVKKTNCLPPPSLKKFLTGQSQPQIGPVPVLKFCVDKEERTLAEVEEILQQYR